MTIVVREPSEVLEEADFPAVKRTGTWVTLPSSYVVKSVSLEGWEGMGLSRVAECYVRRRTEKKEAEHTAFELCLLLFNLRLSSRLPYGVTVPIRTLLIRKQKPRSKQCANSKARHRRAREERKDQMEIQRENRCDWNRPLRNWLIILMGLNNSWTPPNSLMQLPN